MTTLYEIEKNAILQALQRCRWHRPTAAKVLGVTVRTIENKIARYRKEGAEIHLWRNRRAENSSVHRETESISAFGNEERVA